MAVTSESGHTTVFDVSSADRLKTLACCRSGDSFALGVAFQPSGLGRSPVLAIGNADQSTSIWDLGQPSDPQPICVLPGATGNTMAVAFNADGSLLAVRTTSGTVSIWDTTSTWDTTRVAKPQLFARFRSVERGVYALAFSPSQPILTGCGPNQSLFQWTINEVDAVAMIRNAVGDPLTNIDRSQHLPGHYGHQL